MSKNFIHLHNHTYFSFLDGHGSPMSRVKKAKELGMKAMAITDHNHVGGCLDFQSACNEEGLKPILGVELYYTEDTSILGKEAEERFAIAVEKAGRNGIVIPPKAKKKDIKELIAPYEYDTKQHHIIFFAKNQTGWNNLVKLQSEAARICTYNGRFICDDELINKYKEGLIMTTACLGGIVGQYILNGKKHKAFDKIDKWKKMMGDDFYIEIQPLCDEEQAIVNYELIQYAYLNDINIIATNDVHYTNEYDIDDHDTLLCVGIGKHKDDENRMRYLPEFWVRSYDEMIQAFRRQYFNYSQLSNSISEKAYLEQITIALDNTNLIEEKIESNIKLGSDVPILPKLDIPYGFKSSQYLTLLSYEGLFKYAKSNPDIDFNEYKNRLAFELNVINTKGYADYLLIVRDIINWCQEQDIPVGPGRGSASGSLVLFLTGITKCVDPIKYGLLFSRFLTMDRTSLPDIDTDFSYVNRQRVIKYLEDKYGKDCVSFIGTYTEMGVKSGIKDVGRVLKIDFSTMNAISKKIDEITDEAPSIKFKDLDSLAEGNDNEKTKYRQFVELEQEYREIFRLARLFEGTKRNAGIHASGILVTPMPITNMFPTRFDSDGNQVTLYTGPQVEMLGGVKLDILGLKTLDVLDITVKSLHPNASVYDLYEEVDNYLTNEEMYSSLNRKETEGIFQLESALFKGLVSDIQPMNIEDITVITSIARPGPLSAGLHKSFANRKNGEEEITEPLPGTWEIVKDSMGVLVYQEHCMRIAQVVAGFDDNQADSFLRKAMAKKKRAILELCDQWFIYGKINKEPPTGYNPDNKKQPYYDPTGKYGAPITGGINNGYDEKALIDYTVTIKDFCSYLFNKSHASAYSFISCCTMYLKTFYRPQFLAALLSMQDKQEKIDLYCRVADSYGIKVAVPHINISNENFTVYEDKILYGLGSIKGVGKAAIPTLLENRPYEDLHDAYSRAGKKAFNKKVGEALIKAGAFSFLDENRNTLLNEFQVIRGAKKEDPFNHNAFNEDIYIEYEKTILGCPITYKPYWDAVQIGESVSVAVIIEDMREKIDKNGRMMAFITANINKSSGVKGVVFAHTYCNNVSSFEIGSTAILQIKKDDKGGFIVSKVLKKMPEPKVRKNKRNNNLSDIIDEFDNMMEGI